MHGPVIVYNNICLKCDKVEAEMVNLGFMVPVILCNGCFEVEFGGVDERSGLSVTEFQALQKKWLGVYKARAKEEAESWDRETLTKKESHQHTCMTCRKKFECNGCDEPDADDTLCDVCLEKRSEEPKDQLSSILDSEIFDDAFEDED